MKYTYYLSCLCFKQEGKKFVTLLLNFWQIGLQKWSCKEKIVSSRAITVRLASPAARGDCRAVFGVVQRREEEGNCFAPYLSSCSEAWDAEVLFSQLPHDHHHCAMALTKGREDSSKAKKLVPSQCFFSPWPQASMVVLYFQECFMWCGSRLTEKCWTCAVFWALHASVNFPSLFWAGIQFIFFVGQMEYFWYAFLCQVCTRKDKIQLLEDNQIVSSWCPMVP